MITHVFLVPFFLKPAYINNFAVSRTISWRLCSTFFQKYPSVKNHIYSGQQTELSCGYRRSLVCSENLFCLSPGKCCYAKNCLMSRDSTLSACARAALDIRQFLATITSIGERQKNMFNVILLSAARLYRCLDHEDPLHRKVF